MALPLSPNVVPEANAPAPIPGLPAVGLPPAIAAVQAEVAGGLPDLPLPPRIGEFQRRDRLAQSQAQQALGGAPDDAAKVALGEAKPAYDSVTGALSADQLLKPDPYVWSNLADNERLYPLTKLLEDRVTAQQVKDDLPNLIKTADLLHDPMGRFTGWDKAWTGDARSRLAAKLVVNWGSKAEQEAIRAELEKLGARETLLGYVQGRQGWLGDFGDAALALVPTFMGSAPAAAGTAAMLTAPLLPAGATGAGAAVPAAVAVVGFAASLWANSEVGMGQAYLQLKDIKNDKGEGIEEPVIRTAAAISGILGEGIIGTLMAGKILGPLGKQMGKLAPELTKKLMGKVGAVPGVTALMKKALKSPHFVGLLKDFAINASEETLTEIAYILGEHAAAAASETEGLQTASLSQDLNRMGQTFVVGGLLGTAVETGVSTLHTMAQKGLGQVTGAEVNQTLLEGLYETVQSSRFAARNPGEHAALVAATAKAAGVETATVNGATVVDVLAAAGIPDTQVAATMPQVAAQLAQAAVNGGSLTIPMVELVRLIGVDKGGLLKTETGLGADPSVTQAKEIKAEVEKLLAQMKAEGLDPQTGTAAPMSPASTAFTESANRVKNDLTRKHQNAFPHRKRSEGSLSADVTFLASGLIRMAQRLGVDPWTYYMGHVVDFHQEGQPPQGTANLMKKVAAIPATATPEARAAAVKAALEAHVGERMTVWVAPGQSNYVTDTAGRIRLVPTGISVHPVQPPKGGRFNAVNVEVAEIADIKADGSVTLHVPDLSGKRAFFGKPGSVANIYKPHLTGERFNTGKRGHFWPVHHGEWMHIALGKNTSPMTFLHEAAHLFNMLMRDEVASGTAPPEMVADQRLLEKWLGLSKDSPWGKQSKEKFARAFEEHLATGTAPTPELQGVFEKAKVFFIEVYKSTLEFAAWLRNWGPHESHYAELNDDIRGVFDRMIAVEQTATEVEHQNGYAPIDFEMDTVPVEVDADTTAPKDEEAAPSIERMTPEEHARYAALWQKARAEASAGLLTKSLVEMKREVSETGKQIKQDVEDFLRMDPVTRVRELQRAGSEEFKGAPARLRGAWNLSQVEALGLPKQDVNRLKRLGLAASDGKVDPTGLAHAYGFHDAKTMIEQLRDTPPTAEVARQEFKRRMTEKFPGYAPSTDWLEREAQLAWHSDTLASAISVEVEMFNRLNKTPAPRPDTARSIALGVAEQMAAEMTVAQMDPEAVRRAEEKAAREKIKAYAKKDYTAASNLAMRQLVNSYLWKMVTANKRVADATRTYVSTFTEGSTQERYGKLGIAVPDPFNGPDAPRVMQGSFFRDALLTIAQLAAGEPVTPPYGVEAYITEAEAVMGQIFVLDPDVRAGTIGPLDAMTPEKVTQLRESVEEIAGLARMMEKNRARDDVKAAALIASIPADMKDRLEAVTHKDRVASKQNLKNRIVIWFREARVSIEKPETTFADLDGGVPGRWHEAFFQPLKAAEAHQTRLVKTVVDKYRAIGKDFPEFHTMHKRKATFIDGYEYTHLELLGIILNLGNRDNTKKMAYGAQLAKRPGWIDAKGNVNFNGIITALHQIFPEQSTWKLAERLIETAGTNGTELLGTKERVNGREPHAVGATTIPTPDGSTIKGGYWHVAYAHDIAERAGPGDTALGPNATKGAFASRAAVPQGIATERTRAVGMMNLDVQQVLMSAAYEEAHYISHIEPIIALDRLLMREDMRLALVNSIGMERYRGLQNWLGHTANEGRLLTNENSMVTRVINRGISNNAMMAMGFNLRSAFRQITDISAAMSKMPGHTAAAVLDFAKNPFAAFDRVMAEAPDVVEVKHNYDRDIRSMERTREMKARLTASDTLQLWALKPTLFMQSVVNVITYEAGLRDAAAKGLSGDAAIEHAKYMVRSTQSSGGAVDLAPLQRSTDPMARMITSLASFTFTLNDIFMPRQMTKRQWSDSIQRILLYVIFGMVGKALVSQITLAEDEREKARKRSRKPLDLESEEAQELQRLALEAMEEVYGNIPVIGKPLGAVLGTGSSKLGGWADTLAHTPGQVMEAFADPDTKGARAWKAVGDTSSLLTGLPLRNIFFRPGELLYEWSQGNITDLRDVPFTSAGQIGERK